MQKGFVTNLCCNDELSSTMSGTRYIKFKRMGLTEILRGYFLQIR